MGGGRQDPGGVRGAQRAAEEKALSEVAVQVLEVVELFAAECSKICSPPNPAVSQKSAERCAASSGKGR
ncbi:MAG: hypothetical protein WKF28_10185, partial [Rubrobacteraceae bacterium]